MNYRRKEVIGDCTLYLGDCMEIMQEIDPVRTIITSPPYNLGTSSIDGEKPAGHYSASACMAARGGGGKWSKSRTSDGLANGYSSYTDNMPHGQYVEWQQRFLSLCYERLVDDGAIYYNHKPRILNGILVSPLSYVPGLPVRQIVMWARAGGINYSPSYYVPTHEWIVIIAKPKFRLRDKSASGAGDVWRIAQERNDAHPAPFPMKIPAQILETTKHGVVLDPFMGSGTTGAASVRAGRSFIGIEIDTGYFETSCRRIEEEYKRPDLFASRAALSEAQERRK